MPALVDSLFDESVEVRRTAAEAISKIGRRAISAIPALTRSLKDEDEHVRQFAASALANFGPAAKPALPGLIEAIEKNKTPETRRPFLDTIGAIGAEAADAVPFLIRMLSDESDPIREHAIRAIGAIGPPAKNAVPALIYLAKGSKRERYGAMAALGKIGPDAKEAIPLLVNELYKDKTKGPRYDDGRHAAAEALGGIGPAAKRAVPILAMLARAQREGGEIAEQWLRQSAARAVMKIDPEYGAREGIELAYLDIKLKKAPSIKLEPRPPAHGREEKGDQKINRRARQHF